MMAAPKAGSSTLLHFPESDGTEPRRVLVMRDPMDRLRSGFWFFKYLQQEGVDYKGIAPHTYRDYIDMVLSSSDEHWLPQTQLGSGYTEVLSLRLLGEFLMETVGKLFLRDNAMCPMFIDQAYRRPELLRYYAADYEAMA